MATIDQIINYLGNKETIIIDGVSANQFSIQSNSYISGNTDVSSIIPDGYKLVAVIPRNTSSVDWCWTACALTGGVDNSFYVACRRIAGSETKLKPSVALFCQKV